MKRLTLSTKIPSVLCPLFTALEDDNEYCQSQNADCLCCELGEQLIKLAEYEDAEEQGLLIRLPCKPGTIVCEIFQFLNEGAWKIEYHKLTIEDVPKIGKTVFLTREEAKAALAEMDG